MREARVEGGEWRDLLTQQRARGEGLQLDQFAEGECERLPRAAVTALSFATAGDASFEIDTPSAATWQGIGETKVATEHAGKLVPSTLTGAPQEEHAGVRAGLEGEGHARAIECGLSSLTQRAAGATPGGWQPEHDMLGAVSVEKSTEDTAQESWARRGRRGSFHRAPL